MAGRRLLDAAKLFNASRAVARQHVSLRSQQLEVFNKTSSLAKAVKNQTDRITLTAQAAIALSQRFNGPAPPYTTASAPHDHQQHQDASIPREETVVGGNAQGGTKQGLEQDHHYERSEGNATAEPPPEEELGVKQEEASRHPLPDGTIPPSGSQLRGQPSGQDTFFQRPVPEPAKEPLSAEKQQGEDELRPVESDASTIPTPDAKHKLSADDARRLQRQAEFQIPSVSTDAQASPSSETITTELSDGHDRDVYYEPSKHVTSEYSSLPRAKIPKNTQNTQGSNEHVKDEQINSDVFYSPRDNHRRQQIPEKVAVPEQEDVPEGVNLDVFYSPRVAKMLGGRRSGSGPGLQLKAASRTPIDRTGLASGMDQDTFNVRTSDSTAPAAPEWMKAESTTPSAPQVDEDIQNLAADMAKDAQGAPSTVPEIPADLHSTAEKSQYQMRESRVPSSRFGRLWQYTGLATSMAFGAVGESIRRVAGGGIPGSSLMLSPSNMERLVAKLSRMRGAALKLGQMISFQDSKMLPAPIQEVLQRVQDSADYMPASQRNKVLASNLGPDWRDLFSTFDEMPMAAASIGQVHRAVLKSTSQEVAVKVQYPGVANSIDSDLNNLSVLLTASRLLPKGLYLEKTIANARTELGWECDYIREAECATRFKELLVDDTAFTVPAIIPEASGREVLTAELMLGTAVTKLTSLSQAQRDWIGTQILRLCLREITEFHFMQTDPNWTNFLYNAATSKLELLDFGASRDFPPAFIEPYVGVLVAAARDDRAAVRDLSVRLGYLTGHESKAMLDAHVASVLTLAEPFAASTSQVYDFRDQTITDRVRGLIPTMIRERLAPPPEETYSLHRKLSGAFLLCAKLGSRVRCRELFENAVRRYNERRG